MEVVGFSPSNPELQEKPPNEPWGQLRESFSQRGIGDPQEAYKSVGCDDGRRFLWKCWKVAELRRLAFEFDATNNKETETALIDQMVNLARQVDEKSSPLKTLSFDVNRFVGAPCDLARGYLFPLAKDKDCPDGAFLSSARLEEVTEQLRGPISRCLIQANQHGWTSTNDFVEKQFKDREKLDLRIVRAWELVFRTKLIIWPKCTYPIHEDFTTGWNKVFNPVNSLHRMIKEDHQEAERLLRPQAPKKKRGIPEKEPSKCYREKGSKAFTLFFSSPERERLSLRVRTHPLPRPPQRPVKRSVSMASFSYTSMGSLSNASRVSVSKVSDSGRSSLTRGLSSFFFGRNGK